MVDGFVSTIATCGYGSLRARPCENPLKPRTHRIVFSIAFFQEKSLVQSGSTTTKLRQKFYAQVQRRSFHTASRAGIQYAEASRFYRCWLWNTGSPAAAWWADCSGDTTNCAEHERHQSVPRRVASKLAFCPSGQTASRGDLQLIDRWMSRMQS
jgi:hypothetical protein